MTTNVCRACGKPLKNLNVPEGHGFKTIAACKSPICKLFRKAQ